MKNYLMLFIVAMAVLIAGNAVAQTAVKGSTTSSVSKAPATVWSTIKGQATTPAATKTTTKTVAPSATKTPASTTQTAPAVKPAAKTPSATSATPPAKAPSATTAAPSVIGVQGPGLISLPTSVLRTLSRGKRHVFIVHVPSNIPTAEKERRAMSVFRDMMRARNMGGQLAQEMAAAKEAGQMARQGAMQSKVAGEVSQGRVKGWIGSMMGDGSVVDQMGRFSPNQQYGGQGGYGTRAEGDGWDFGKPGNRVKFTNVGEPKTERIGTIQIRDGHIVGATKGEGGREYSVMPDGSRVSVAVGDPGIGMQIYVFSTPKGGNAEDESEFAGTPLTPEAMASGGNFDLALSRTRQEQLMTKEEDGSVERVTRGVDVVEIQPPAGNASNPQEVQAAREAEQERQAAAQGPGTQQEQGGTSSGGEEQCEDNRSVWWETPGGDTGVCPKPDDGEEEGKGKGEGEEGEEGEEGGDQAEEGEEGGETVGDGDESNPDQEAADGDQEEAESGDQPAPKTEDGGEDAGAGEEPEGDPREDATTKCIPGDARVDCRVFSRTDRTGGNDPTGSQFGTGVRPLGLQPAVNDPLGLQDRGITQFRWINRLLPSNNAPKAPAIGTPGRFGPKGPSPTPGK